MKYTHTTVVLCITVATALQGCGKKEEPSIESTSEIVCSYAPSQSAVVAHISSVSGGGAIAAAAVAKAAGLTAVTHSSGAYIFTGASGYIAGTIGSAIIAPVVVGVGIAVGSSAVTLELLCAPRNHPGFAAKVEESANEFWTRSKGITTSVNDTARPIVADIKSAVVTGGIDAVQYASRKSVELVVAMKKATQ